MKKSRAILIIFMTKGIVAPLYGAEATSVKEFLLPEQEQKASDTVQNPVFAMGIPSSRILNTLFDTFSWQNNSYRRNAPDRTILPGQSTSMVGIQAGAFYYVFVLHQLPRERNKHVLVFQITDTGRIVRTSTGQKYITLPIDTPLSIAVSKDQLGIPWAFIATQANTIERFALIDDQWISRGALSDECGSKPISEGVAASAGESRLKLRRSIMKRVSRHKPSGAAEAAPQFKASLRVIHAQLYKELIYLFVMCEETSDIKAFTMDKDGTIVHKEELDIQGLPSDLTTNPDDSKFASAVYNDQLYLFMFGKKVNRRGFIYGWRLRLNGQFDPIIQQDDIPQTLEDLVINATPEGLYISVTYLGSYSIDTYRLVGDRFERPKSTRMKDTSTKMSGVPYRNNEYLAVLQSIFPHNESVISMYYVQPNELVKVAENELASDANYHDFLLVPGVTKSYVTEVIESATVQKYPKEISGLISEFVTQEEENTPSSSEMGAHTQQKELQ